MSLGTAMGFWAIGTMQVHASTFLGSVGNSTTAAATLVTGLSVATIPGRMLFGWLADRKDTRRLMAAGGTRVFSLASGSRPWVLPLFLLTYAPAFGGMMVLQPAMQRQYFGRRSFGAIAGVIGAFTVLVWSGGPLLMNGLLNVATYPAAFWGYGVLTMAGIPFVLAIRW